MGMSEGSTGKMQEEQGRIYNDLVQTLRDRGGLEEGKARQIADLVGEFAQQHLSDLLRAYVPGGGMLGGLGKLFGGRG